MHALSLKRPFYRRYWLLRDRFHRKPVRTVFGCAVLGYALLYIIPLGFGLLLLALPFYALFSFIYVVRRGPDSSPAQTLPPVRRAAPPPVPQATGWVRQRQELLEKWETFLRQLTPGAMGHYGKLRQTVQRLGTLFPLPEDEKSPLLRPGEYLLWLYLKLLLARDHLEANARESRVEDLQTQLTTLETEAQQPNLTPAARESKQETAVLLRQRLAVAESRRARLQEVESDLTRIEHKIALLYDQAVQQNSMNDAGLRINLPAEAMHLQSLSPSAGGGMDQLDSLMTAQLSAH